MAREKTGLRPDAGDAKFRGAVLAAAATIRDRMTVRWRVIEDRDERAEREAKAIVLYRPRFNRGR